MSSPINDLEDMEAGHVYFITNKAMPGLVKIGFTTRDVPSRLLELSSTGVPTPFELEFCIHTEQPRKLEARLHRMFQKHKFGKEFFKIDLYHAIKETKTYLLVSKEIWHKFEGRSTAIYLTEVEIEAQRIEKTRQSQLAEALRFENERKRKESLEAARLLQKARAEYEAGCEQWAEKFARDCLIVEGAMRKADPTLFAGPPAITGAGVVKGAVVTAGIFSGGLGLIAGFPLIEFAEKRAREKDNERWKRIVKGLTLEELEATNRVHQNFHEAFNTHNHELAFNKYYSLTAYVHKHLDSSNVSPHMFGLDVRRGKGEGRNLLSRLFQELGTQSL